MKFYFDLLSQPSRALYIFLKMNKIPFEPVVTKIGRRENMTERFREINRFQKLPCIDDNGFKLAETVAIFRYLVAKNEGLVEDNWYPKDLEKRAKVDEYLEWQHLGTRAGCAGYFLAAYINPLLRWKNPSPKKLEAAKSVMEKNLNLLENVWLKDPSKPFLATSEISFADVLAACELEMPKLADYDPFAGRPRLTKWHQLVKEQTNPVYDEAHGAAYGLIGSYQRSKLYKVFKIYFSYNY